jgi:hypothetical protein
MKQVAKLILSVSALLLFLTTAGTSAVRAEPSDYTEGISFSLRRGSGIAFFTLRVSASKVVQNGSAVSQVYINYYGPGTSPSRVLINETVTLPGDPDLLEVSEDLGWGGLNNQVWVTDQTTGAKIRVRFNLNLFALSPQQSEDTVFFRNADVRGTVRIGGTAIPFNRPNDPFNLEYGRNYVTYPLPF